MKVRPALETAGVKRRRHSSMLLAVSCMACGLDERHLLSELAGNIASDAGDTASARPGDPLARDAGSLSSDVLVDGCADLDTDGVSDCDPGLLSNATFDSDVESWTALGGTEITWDEQNALEDTRSGSAHLSGLGNVTASQCVRLRGRRLVVVYANALVAPGDAGPGARASVAVEFFDDAECNVPAGPFFTTPFADGGAEWITIHAGGVTDSDNRSLLVSLAASSGRVPTPVEVRFDNVLLKATKTP